MVPDTYCHVSHSSDLANFNKLSKQFFHTYDTAGAGTMLSCQGLYISMVSQCCRSVRGGWMVDAWRFTFCRKL